MIIERLSAINAIYARIYGCVCARRIIQLFAKIETEMNVHADVDGL